MPRVPYQPYSDVVPSGANVSPATPPEAFGVGVARATEQFGGEVSQAGDKLFNRALAMQQLNNETEAEQANLKLMGEAGDLHAQYNALQGEERVKAFPQYKQNLLDLQSKIRGSLSNDMARRMFDRPSLNTIGHSIFNGAGAAASAQREWVGNTASSTMDMLVKSTSDDPTNDILAERNRAAIIAAANKVAYAKHGVGPDSPIAQDIAMKGVSAAARERLVSVARVDPWQAEQMEEAAVTRGDLTGPDKQHVDNFIRTQSRTIESASIARQVYNEGQETEDKPGMSMKEMINRARDMAAERSKDPLAPEYAEAAVRKKWSTDRAISAIEQHTNEQTIYRAIQEGRTEQEILADPKLSNAYQALPSTSPLKRKPLNYQITGYTNQRDSDLMDANYTRLRGLSSNDVQQFLETNLADEKLKKADMNKLLTIRDRIIRQQNADPRVQHAVTILRGNMGAQLDELKIFNRKGNENQFDHFTGALSASLDAWQERTGKPATDKDITETIGPQVIRQQLVPFLGLKYGGFLGKEGEPFWPSRRAAFDVDTSSPDYLKFHEAYITFEKSEGRAEPSDEDIYKQYQRVQWKRMFGKKKE